MDHHVGDGHREWEDLDLFDNHWLGIGTNRFDNFAVI